MNDVYEILLYQVKTLIIHTRMTVDHFCSGKPSLKRDREMWRSIYYYVLDSRCNQVHIPTFRMSDKL